MNLEMLKGNVGWRMQLARSVTIRRQSHGLSRRWASQRGSIRDATKESLKFAHRGRLVTTLGLLRRYESPLRVLGGSCTRSSPTDSFAASPAAPGNLPSRFRRPSGRACEFRER